METHESDEVIRRFLDMMWGWSGEPEDDNEAALVATLYEEAGDLVEAAEVEGFLRDRVLPFILTGRLPGQSK